MLDQLFFPSDALTRQLWLCGTSKRARCTPLSSGWS